MLCNSIGNTGTHYLHHKDMILSEIKGKTFPFPALDGVTISGGEIKIDDIQFESIQLVKHQGYVAVNVKGIRLSIERVDVHLELGKLVLLEKSRALLRRRSKEGRKRGFFKKAFKKVVKAVKKVVKKAAKAVKKVVKAVKNVVKKVNPECKGRIEGGLSPTDFEAKVKITGNSTGSLALEIMDSKFTSLKFKLGSF